MKCGGKWGKWPRYWKDSSLYTVTGILVISLLGILFYGSYSGFGSFI